jgi:predicted metalloprotease
VTSKTQSDFQHQTHRELVYRPLQFHKRSQLFVRADDETLSVAIRVNNPDRSPLRIKGGDPAQTPTGFAKSVSDDFPVNPI